MKTKVESKQSRLATERSKARQKQIAETKDYIKKNFDRVSKGEAKILFAAGVDIYSAESLSWRPYCLTNLITGKTYYMNYHKYFYIRKTEEKTNDD